MSRFKLIVFDQVEWRCEPCCFVAPIVWPWGQMGWFWQRDQPRNWERTAGTFNKYRQVWVFFVIFFLIKRRNNIVCCIVLFINMISTAIWDRLVFWSSHVGNNVIIYWSLPVHWIACMCSVPAFACSLTHPMCCH